MKIKLKELKLKNFKGIKDKTIDFKGKDTVIEGQNATGKTTIFDAFTWILFGKDSDYKTQFGIKTTDEEGNEIHGLEHEVEALLQVGNSNMTLRKVYKENWTNPKGTQDQVLSGHTTDYFVNDVPVKKKDYDSKINEVIDEDFFKLITNPLYFNKELHWKERRTILMDIIGDVDEMDVINSNEELSKLKEFLSDKDIEEFKKSVAYKIKKLKKEIDSIPYRIDEVNNSIEEVDEYDEKIDNLIAARKQELEHFEDQINDKSKVYEKNSEINKQIYQLKDKLQKIEREDKKESQRPKQRLKEEINDLENKLKQLKFDIKIKNKTIKNNENDIELLENKKSNLKEKWFEVDEKEFDGSIHCPTCGQEYPEEKKEEIVENFYDMKNDELKEINTKGKRYKKEQENLELENKQLENELEKMKSNKNTIEEKIDVKRQKISDLDDYEFVPGEEYKAIESEIEELENQKVNPDESEINKLKEQKKNLQKDIDRLKGIKNQMKQNDKARQRIQELKEKERELSNQISELEGQQYLTEEFIRTKVDLLEERINKKFDTVKFKLFEEQLNGGLNETCIALINGVPFDDANNAGKINSGIEIINVLCDYYDVSAPIFVDNAEAVNNLKESDSQVIQLIVSEETGLNIKTEEELKKEVA